MRGRSSSLLPLLPRRQVHPLYITVPRHRRRNTTNRHRHRRSRPTFRRHRRHKRSPPMLHLPRNRPRPTRMRHPRIPAIRMRHPRPTTKRRRWHRSKGCISTRRLSSPRPSPSSTHRPRCSSNRPRRFLLRERSGSAVTGTGTLAGSGCAAGGCLLRDRPSSGPSPTTSTATVPSCTSPATGVPQERCSHPRRLVSRFLCLSLDRAPVWCWGFGPWAPWVCSCRRHLVRGLESSCRRRLEPIQLWSSAHPRSSVRAWRSRPTPADGS
jgi:hypothetical protein